MVPVRCGGFPFAKHLFTEVTEICLKLEVSGFNYHGSDYAVHIQFFNLKDPILHNGQVALEEL